MLVVAVLVLIGYVYSVGKPAEQAIAPGTEEPVSAANAALKTPASKASVPTSAKSGSVSYLGRDGVYVVQYTDEGFVPATLQIPRGKSVRFINMSTKGMRVFSDSVSDPKLVELNQSKTVGKGGTYTFSFVNEGLWQYHNELEKTHTASVTVY